MSADYSQAEIRVLAAVAGEERLLDMYRQGVDIHTATAKSIFGRDVSSLERRFSKMGTFCIIYGGTPESFNASFLGGDKLDTAQKIFNGFYAAYPKIKEWMDAQHEAVLRTGRVINTITGRATYLGFSDDPFVQEKIMRQAGNAPIQGASSDLASLALSSIDLALPKSQVIDFVHDSIACDIHPSDILKGLEVYSKDLIDIPQSYGVPAASEITLGYSLGEEIEVKSFASEGSTITINLEGFLPSIYRVIISWSRYYTVKFEIQTMNPKYISWAGVMQEKYAYNNDMGKVTLEASVTVTLSLDSNGQPAPNYDELVREVENDIKLDRLFPLNYNNRELLTELSGVGRENYRGWR